MYWLRLLLHIPSICSHPQQPLDTYGHGDAVITKPKYVLLYIWSIYEKADGQSIHIEYNLWICLYFRTSTKFNHFLWLGIARVNTSPHSGMIIDDEINRQTDSHFSVKQSFAWLTRTSGDHLREVNDILTTVTASMEKLPQHVEGNNLMEEWWLQKVECLQSVYEELLTDLWYLSLWVLQETLLVRGNHTAI